MDRFDTVDLVQLARKGLELDGGDPANASLQISLIPRRKVARLAYDTPQTYGRPGARWYQDHHALARLLSKAAGLTVHAYVIDDEHEEVVGYGNGACVGGESLRYVEADFADELDDESFDLLQARWPLGHLAQIYGVKRTELLALPRAPSALVPLDAPDGAAHLDGLLVRQLIAS